MGAINYTLNMSAELIAPILNEIQDINCKCGAPSTIGCHGIKDGCVYDEYYCEECYNKL